MSINRLPRDATGLIIEAQGVGFYPMYVNPNGRYSSEAHNHPFTDLTGLLAASQLPQDTAGYVLEAQGVGFWSMYVEPDYRYLPAPHQHSAGDVTSGGVVADVAVAKVGGGTRTLHFVNSMYRVH